MAAADNIQSVRHAATAASTAILRWTAQRVGPAPTPDGRLRQLIGERSGAPGLQPCINRHFKQPDVALTVTHPTVIQQRASEGPAFAGPVLVSQVQTRRSGSRRRPQPNAWIDAAGPDTGGHPYVGRARVCAGQPKLCKVGGDI